MLPVSLILYVCFMVLFSSAKTFYWSFVIVFNLDGVCLLTSLLSPEKCGIFSNHLFGKNDFKTIHFDNFSKLE